MGGTYKCNVCCVSMDSTNNEVTVKGKKTQNGKRITWYQYCGMLTRGDRKSLESLVLEKMKVKSSRRRG